MKIEYHASILRTAKTERDICITMLLEKQHYFWFGEVGMAGTLAGRIAVPAGIVFLLFRFPVLSGGQTRFKICINSSSPILT